MPENLKLLLDTNFFIRFFTADEPTQHQDCLQIIEHIQSGKFKPYLSNLVLTECSYVLTKIYHISNPQLKIMFQAILNLRNLTILETTNTPLALNWHWQTGVKLNDCLIATQLKPGIILCTYDREFRRLPEIFPEKIMTPTEILRYFVQK